MPSSTLELDFKGPYRFVGRDRSVFEAPCAASPGVYLWTVKQHDGTHMIHYIGQTSAFAKRQREHLIQVLGLNYGIFNAEKAQTGVSELIWPGMCRKLPEEGPLQAMEEYKRINEKVLEYLSVLNVFFAEADVGRSLLRHIEGCIGWNLRNNHPESKALFPDGVRVGTLMQKDHGLLRIRSTEPIRGLDAEIPY